MWKLRPCVIPSTSDTISTPRLIVKPYLLQTGVSLNRPGVILPRCAPIGTFSLSDRTLKLPTKVVIWAGTVLKQRLLSRRPPEVLRFTRAWLASSKLGWVVHKFLLIRKHLRLYFRQETTPPIEGLKQRTILRVVPPMVCSVPSNGVPQLSDLLAQVTNMAGTYKALLIMKIGEDGLYVSHLWVLNAPWTFLPGNEELLDLRRISNPFENLLSTLFPLLRLIKVLRPLVAFLASGRN